jgi:hypothetical protein
MARIDLQNALAQAMRSALEELDATAMRPAARSFVTGGWITDAPAHAARAINAWKQFLTVAQNQRVELNAWSPPIAVASSMQLMYGRLAWLWLTLPGGGANNLHADLEAVLSKEIAEFTDVIANTPQAPQP